MSGDDSDDDDTMMVFVPSAEADTTLKVLREFVDNEKMPRYCQLHPGEFPKYSPYKPQSILSMVWKIAFPASLETHRVDEIATTSKDDPTEQNTAGLAVHEQYPKESNVKKRTKKEKNRKRKTH